MAYKREGFFGQRIIVLPKNIVRKAEKNPLLANLHLTDIGYFPHATAHYVERPNGVAQHILIYCTEGMGWCEMGTHRFEVRPNQVFVIPANTAHRYGARENRSWSIYWVHFTGSASKHVSPCRGDGVLAKVAWSKERILLFEEIMHSLETGYTEENIGFANVCLWHFLGTFMYPDQFEASARKNEPDIISKAVYYMKLNHERALSLEILASKVHVSIPHFMALFKSKTGYSPIDYHNRLRIQRACQYLDLTDMKIKEISTAVGYDDPYYFSRVFRKVMGESPSVYRGKQKG